MSSVRMSVSLSVTLVDCDHICWKSWKLISRTLSPTPMLFVAQRPSTYSMGTWGICGRIEVGCKKVACWSTKAAISPKRVKIEEMLQWGAYRNSSTLCRTVPSPTPYGLSFPRFRFAPHPRTSIATISRTGKATDFKFGRYIQRVHPKNPLKFARKWSRSVDISCLLYTSPSPRD